MGTPVNRQKNRTGDLFFTASTQRINYPDFPGCPEYCAIIKTLDLDYSELHFTFVSMTIPKQRIMKRSWRRGLLGGFSFAGALFIFQCCYGMPQDLERDLLVEGQVKSKKTGQPIKGIQVSLLDESQSVFTDGEGKFDLYMGYADRFEMWFRDIDGGENGAYLDRDTLVENTGDKVYVEIELEEK